jgi:ribosomal protein S27E
MFNVYVDFRVFYAFMATVPELQKKMKALTGLFVNGAFLFSDIVLVAIYKGFVEIRGSHLRTGVTHDDYEKMIAHLVKLDMVKPRMRVSICPNCMNTELVVSNHPSMNDACPKCGTSWSSAVLFLFEEQFGKIKSLNNDLPLFISTYLKHQIGLNAFGEKIEILPNAVVAAAEKQVEIDVFIPEYKIGIECKNYLTSSMPDTLTRIEGLAGQFRAQLMNYKQAGIEQVFIVANLPNKTFDLLRKKMSEDATKNTALPKAVIIQGNTDSLLEFLKKLSLTLVSNAKMKLETSFQKQLQENSKAENKEK